MVTYETWSSDVPSVGRFGCGLQTVPIACAATVLPASSTLTPLGSSLSMSSNEKTRKWRLRRTNGSLISSPKCSSLSIATSIANRGLFASSSRRSMRQTYRRSSGWAAAREWISIRFRVWATSARSYTTSTKQRASRKSSGRWMLIRSRENRRRTSWRKLRPISKSWRSNLNGNDCIWS